MIDNLFGSNPENSGILVVGSLAALLGAHLVLSFILKSFKRDSYKSFGFVSDAASLLSNSDSVLGRDGVKESIAGYERLFSGARKNVGTTTTADSIQHREKEYATMVNSFYDLVTDFYEWGWGQSFHFAPRLKGETFEESIYRAEHYLALRSNITPTSKVLDVGCGVGGPMRNIQQFTGADITGVTINEYQVNVGNQYCAQKGIDQKCRLIQGDFQKLPEKFEAGTFDAAYAIEATCHSPDRKICFSGVNHCLKKGGLFVGYDWVVLPETGYDEKNPEHVRVKEGIEVGNGLPTLATSQEVVRALEESGFEVLDSFDANRNVHSDREIPWYQTLYGSFFTLSGFRMTHIGRICTHSIVSALEFMRIAPKGSVRVSSLLNATALDLVEGGKEEIFTPSFFFLARKK
ncbi:cycloartenol-C-24-methyltransferase [Skeletonema marinoi]|uniref:Methyltransferase n=1 Tax=Skeletonema marinoi TaxID=267567 RepID=A0A7S2PD46_9STRA|nr:cycloartenol-C-24-methyltransferase [Skeletonema marinoi]|mmetsp:Transcript_5881/g.12478  ORF Transcript_5881/g.12478 Transcript_5881/m.12478 type:complete len:405 (-) Transcript_5881:153-1367(-)